MEPLLAAAPPFNSRNVDELTYQEIRALDADRTVCVCAVSALEVHGPHLAFGALAGILLLGGWLLL